MDRKGQNSRNKLGCHFKMMLLKLKCNYNHKDGLSVSIKEHEDKDTAADSNDDIIMAFFLT